MTGSINKTRVLITPLRPNSRSNDCVSYVRGPMFVNYVCQHKVFLKKIEC